MRKTFVFIVLLLSLFMRNVNAAPNTGTLPENGIKIEFNNSSVSGFEAPDDCTLHEGVGTITITCESVVISIDEFVLKDDELIGFTWTIEGASTEFWVKHGTTEQQYDGQFITDDNKGISNTVWIITLDEDDDENDDDNEDDNEEEDDDDDNDDEIDNDDEEEDVDDDDEVIDDEDDDDEIIDEDEEDEEDEEVVEEDEEEEELPDTSDAGLGLGIGTGLLGLLGLFFSRKEN